MALGAADADVEQRKGAQQYTAAHAQMQADLIGLHTEMQNDPDYATAPERYQKKIQEITTQNAERIESPAGRQKFVALSKPMVAEAEARVTARATGLYRSDLNAKGDEQNDAMINSAAASQDEGIRRQALDSVNSNIDSRVLAGALTPAEGQKLKKHRAEEFATADVMAISKGDDATRKAEAIKQLKAVQEPAAVEPNQNNKATSSPYQIASQQVGLHEQGQREVLSNFIGKIGGRSVDPAVTPWCAGWANAVLKNAGYGGTDSLAARSFLKYGSAVDDPQKGDIVVMSRGNDQSKGHVGFFAGPGDTPGTIKILGGNQGNKVSIAEYPASSVLGYRRMREEDVVGQQPPVGPQISGDSVGGKASQMVADASGKVVPGAQAGDANLYSIIPAPARQRLIAELETSLTKDQVKQQGDRFDSLNRQIIDSKAGIQPLPPRELIEKDPVLDEGKKNVLLQHYDTAEKKNDVLRTTYEKFKDPNAGPFNPYNTDERKAVDQIYAGIGGADPDPAKQQAALQATIERTATIPDSVALQIRGGLTSTSADLVQKSLTLATNILTRSPHVFAGATGQKDVETAALTYRHFVDDLGMTSAQATKKYMEMQTPEYQAKLAKIKSEDVAKIVQDKVSINDLRGAFDDSWLGWRINPQVGFSAGQRQSMYDTYIEQFKQHYAETGDVGLAKDLAANGLKKVWGVSTVNGDKVVMPYPPEKSPRFAGMENAAEAISAQAIKAIKDETGQDVTREKLQFQPIPGVTASAFKAGQPTPYNILWTDKDGTVHSLNPGRAFVPDAQAEADRVRTERAAEVTSRRSNIEDKATAAAQFGQERNTFAEKMTTMREAAVKGKKPPALTAGVTLP